MTPPRDADGLRRLMDDATPPDHGEETWEQKQAWDRSNEASQALAALAPELAALVLDMGDVLMGILHDLDNGDDPGRGQKEMARDLLARLDQLGKEEL